jgi:hypothetical protein
MNIFQFHKPAPTPRRRRKKSHKWIERAKAEVERMPSLANLEEDIVIKAAILCSAGHYSLKLNDFKWKTIEEAAFVQNIIWAIEALQQKYPRYLQYARYVAVKQGIELTERKRKLNRWSVIEDRRNTAPEMVPPPEMGKLMQEERDRHFAGYRKRAEMSNSESLLTQFLTELNRQLKLKSNDDQSADQTEKNQEA